MTSDHEPGSSATGYRRNVRRRQAGVITVCLAVSLLVLLAATGATGAQTDDPATEAMIVDVQETGDATVTLTVPFDLTVDDERAAFEEFSSDESRQQRLLDRYETRLANIVSETNTRTDREMAVTEPQIEAETDGSDTVGVVRVTVTWEKLAATDGEQLRISAPFDSGFETDRTLVIEPPEQYRVTAATPQSSSDDGTLWESDRQLDGFEVSMEPTADPGSESTGSDGSGPGFGVLAGVVAVGALLLLARGRR